MLNVFPSTTKIIRKMLERSGGWWKGAGGTTEEGEKGEDKRWRRNEQSENTFFEVFEEFSPNDNDERHIKSTSIIYQKVFFFIFLFSPFLPPKKQFFVSLKVFKLLRHQRNQLSRLTLLPKVSLLISINLHMSANFKRFWLSRQLGLSSDSINFYIMRGREKRAKCLW